MCLMLLSEDGLTDIRPVCSAAVGHQTWESMTFDQKSKEMDLPACFHKVWFVVRWGLQKGLG